MKVNAGKLFEAEMVLFGALRERRAVLLPTVAAFRIALLTRQLEPAYLAMQASRVALLKRFGVEDKAQPGFWAVLPENTEAFQAEWATITAEELDVRCQPIPLAMLGDGASYFTVQELLLLGDFVTDA